MLFEGDLREQAEPEWDASAHVGRAPNEQATDSIGCGRIYLPSSGILEFPADPHSRAFVNLAGSPGRPWIKQPERLPNVFLLAAGTACQCQPHLFIHHSAACKHKGPQRKTELRQLSWSVPCRVRPFLGRLALIPTFQGTLTPETGQYPGAFVRDLDRAMYSIFFDGQVPLPPPTSHFARQTHPAQQASHNSNKRIFRVHGQ